MSMERTMERTEIIFLLDRSGSMEGLEQDTIGGYNGLIRKQLKESGKTLITTVLFDHLYEVLYEGEEIQHAMLSKREYFVRGSTALLDAIGKSIHQTSARLETLRKEEQPDHILFVITTDGLENSSTEFSKGRIRKMIDQKTTKEGWNFIFMGANMDSMEEAGSIGIDREYAHDFAAEPAGVDSMYQQIHADVIRAKCSNHRKKI